MNAMLRRGLPVALAALLGTIFAAAPLVAHPCGPETNCPKGPSAQPCAECGEESPAELRESLRKSTVTAIQLEIDTYTLKLKAAADGTGDEANKARFRQKIADLEAERERFERMPAGEYPDPSTSVPESDSVLDEAAAYGPIVPARLREAFIVAAGPYDIGDLLEVEGTSRSGPFFHLAGILGGDAAILTAGKPYRITMYLVYRREYYGFIGDYYVYVGGVR